MGAKKISKQINIFLKRLEKRYNPQKVILFGSYAENKAHEESDVDIIVIANSFKDIRPYERFKALYNMSNDLEPDFHVFGFTPEETKKNKKNSTLKKALSSGMLLA